MLSSLQEQIQSSAETISQVTGLDVEVVDIDLIRVAGTGVYAGGVGSNIKQAGNLLKATLAGELPLFIENPRENKICRGCRNKVNCKELLSICAPITDGNKLYGAIELICFSEAVRERVLAQREIYINFLVLFARNFADSARQKFELQDITSLLNAMSVFAKKCPKFVVVEPDAANCYYVSACAADGKPHSVDGDLLTLMAGLACGEPNLTRWEMLLDYPVAYASCADDVAATGMRILGAPIKGDQPVTSGESGAATMGFLHWLMQDNEGQVARERLGLNEESTVLCISTEGDTSPELYKEIMWSCKNSL